MTPLVVVALLVGILLGWVWQRTRVAATRLETAMARAETRAYARAATRNADEARLAWAYADHQERRADQFNDELDDAWDAGWQNGVGIRVDLGEVEP